MCKDTLSQQALTLADNVLEAMRSLEQPTLPVEGEVDAGAYLTEIDQHVADASKRLKNAFEGLLDLYQSLRNKETMNGVDRT